MRPRASAAQQCASQHTLAKPSGPCSPPPPSSAPRGPPHWTDPRHAPEVLVAAEAAVAGDAAWTSFTYDPRREDQGGSAFRLASAGQSVRKEIQARGFVSTPLSLSRVSSGPSAGGSAPALRILRRRWGWFSILWPPLGRRRLEPCRVWAKAGPELLDIAPIWPFSVQVWRAPRPNLAGSGVHGLGSPGFGRFVVPMSVRFGPALATWATSAECVAGHTLARVGFRVVSTSCAGAGLSTGAGL